ncbi:unnamed protein product [Lepidochelys kempii]
MQMGVDSPQKGGGILRRVSRTVHVLACNAPVSSRRSLSACVSQDCPLPRLQLLIVRCLPASLSPALSLCLRFPRLYLPLPLSLPLQHCSRGRTATCSPHNPLSAPPLALSRLATPPGDAAVASSAEPRRAREAGDGDQLRTRGAAAGCRHRGGSVGPRGYLVEAEHVLASPLLMSSAE